MSRVLYKLTARQVAAKISPGRLSDGGGLYLVTSPGGRKRWVFIYARQGKRHEMGLGSAGAIGVSLANARAAAAQARQMLWSGEDPLENKRKRAGGKITSHEPKAPEFGKFADEYITTMRPSWHSEKHAAQWSTTLTVHAQSIRSKRLNEIDTESVLEVLRPIWTKTPETAQRLRGRIEAVLDAAKSKGYRDGENPARWRGHLSHLLPKRQKLTRGHHRSLHYEKVPEFTRLLRADSGVLARLIEFTILTASRSNEVRGMEWCEIDFEKKIWTVPPVRMKAKREHRVTLCERAIEIVREMRNLSDGKWVFQSSHRKKFCDMATVQYLKRCGYGDEATMHGFRASFRTWASDQTAYSHEVCEAALAHVVRDQTVAAYQRGDLLEKRRKLMEEWSSFCESGAQETQVVPLKGAGILAAE